MLHCVLPSSPFSVSAVGHMREIHIEIGVVLLVVVLGSLSHVGYSVLWIQVEHGNGGHPKTGETIVRHSQVVSPHCVT
jgi:hypothetical protein